MTNQKRYRKRKEKVVQALTKSEDTSGLVDSWLSEIVLRHLQKNTTSPKDNSILPIIVGGRLAKIDSPLRSCNDYASIIVENDQPRSKKSDYTALTIEAINLSESEFAISDQEISELVLAKINKK